MTFHGPTSDKAALEAFNPPATNIWRAVAEALTEGIHRIPLTARYAIAIGAVLTRRQVDRTQAASVARLADELALQRRENVNYKTEDQLSGSTRILIQPRASFVKLVPNEGNSGIQFRSEPLPRGEVKGYQADVGVGWWGKLYEEHGRELLWKESGEAHVKKGEWNRYEIIAVGSRIRTYINCQLCVDLDDPPGAKRGIVAFQLHSGGAFEVRYRDLKLELDPVTKTKP